MNLAVSAIIQDEEQLLAPGQSSQRWPISSDQANGMISSL